MKKYKSDRIDLYAGSYLLFDPKSPHAKFQPFSPSHFYAHGLWNFWNYKEGPNFDDGQMS